MAISLESSTTADQNSIDFRAPPPSPIAAGHQSSFRNDDVFESLSVPDLILPDQVFPRQNSIQNPPIFDFESLNSPGVDSISKILDSIGRIGCFQIVNHGIRRELIMSVSKASTGIFSLAPDKKAVVSRSPDKSYGFEEFGGKDERVRSEEFVWCRDQGLNLEMEGIWPLGYSNFSEKIERLLLEIEKVAERVLLALEDHINARSSILEEGQDFGGSICYLYKHCGIHVPADQRASSLRYDVIRMLIRGSDYSHALCVHVCDGSSEFHVYSKKGSWVSFCPDKDALVITIGNQIQAWSGGQYKHVIGRPIHKGEDEEDCISMAFLYSPPNISNSFKTNKGFKTISLGQQAIIAIVLNLIYHLFVYIYKL